MTTPRGPMMEEPRRVSVVESGTNAVSRPSAGMNGSGDAWPRYLNAIIAIWLFISAFVWPHTPALRTDTWIVAVLMFVVAVGSLGSPRARYANTVLAIWLFFSTIFMPSVRAGTLWNNIIVAVVVFALSLAPTRSMLPGHPAHS